MVVRRTPVRHIVVVGSIDVGVNCQLYCPDVSDCDGTGVDVSVGVFVTVTVTVTVTVSRSSRG